MAFAGAAVASMTVTQGSVNMAAARYRANSYDNDINYMRDSHYGHGNYADTSPALYSVPVNRDPYPNITRTTMGQKLLEQKPVPVPRKTSWEKFKQFFTVGGTGRHKKGSRDFKWESK